MDCSITEARELISNELLWPKVRDYLAAGGAFESFPAKDPSRLKLLDAATRQTIGVWIEAIALADSWRKIVDGATVRKLKASYSGVYPEVFRYTAYFVKWRSMLDKMVLTAEQQGCPISQVTCPDFAMILLLLKLKFPEAYNLCCC